MPPLLHTTLVAACDEIEVLEANMRAVERQLAALVSTMPDAQLLQTVPGVGLITATALVALVTDIRRFPSGRHFASFLGLTPREDSSALRRRLGAISKQGDVYVRMLLTHGARSLVWHAKAARTAHVAATVGDADRAAAWAQCRRRGRGEQTRSNRVGRVGAAAPLRGRSPARVIAFRLSLTQRTAPSAPHHGAPVGPARGLRR